MGTAIDEYKPFVRRNEPIVFNGLSFSPLKVEQIALYQAAKPSFELMQSSLPPKLATLSWCECLEALDMQGKEKGKETVFLTIVLVTIAIATGLPKMQENGEEVYPIKEVRAKDGKLLSCQLNSITKEFTENTRMIQGKAAYAIRGINDFTREYTEDRDSVHIMAFTIERQEPLEQDSIELQVADYYSFSWVVSLKGNDHMVLNSTQQIVPTSYRNECLVESTEEHPITIPSALIYTFGSVNWVTLANKLAALNNTNINNIRAFGNAIALSKVLPR